MQLYRKHAPRSFADVVGQDKAIEKLIRLRDTRGLAGRAYWITGASGTGKTTIANIIARTIADEYGIDEADASGISGAKVVDMERSLATRCMFGEGRAVILNEAHGLRKDGIRQLLITLERIPAHVAWIFTTTKAGNETLFEDCDDAAPLVSRCLKIELTNQGLSGPFAVLAKRIHDDEGGAASIPLAKFEALAKSCKNNMRMMLSAIEAGNVAA